MNHPHPVREGGYARRGTRPLPQNNMVNYHQFRESPHREKEQQAQWSMPQRNLPPFVYHPRPPLPQPQPQPQQRQHYSNSLRYPYRRPEFDTTAFYGRGLHHSRYNNHGGNTGSSVATPSRLEFWLRQRGLGRFAERLADFGVESLPDLLDSDIVSDIELRNEIGMNESEVKQFRRAVQENRSVDWSHLDAAHCERVRHARSAMASQKHEGYEDFILFVRKMKRSMHFSRVDKIGRLHSCTMRFTKSNSGLTFTRGGVKVDLSFEAMRGVHALVRPEGEQRAGHLLHREMDKLLPVLALGVSKRAFMLTFSYRDDTMEEEMDAFDAGDSLLDRKPKKMRGGGILGNILRIFGRNQVSTADQSSTKSQTSGAAGGGGGFAAFSAALSKQQQQQQPVGVKQGGGASMFAQLVLQASKVDKANKMLVEVAHTEAPNGKADFAMEHASVSNIGYKKLSDSCTAAEYADGKGEGCVCLILVCANVEDMKKAVKGLELGMNHYHRHSNTNQDLYKKGGLFNKKKPKWLRGLDYFHHLYRAHYHHQHPPRRFHNGIVAEVTYDETYDIVMEFEGSDGATHSTMLPMPCPVFQPGMFLRAMIIGYDWTTETYELMYTDGPYLGDEQPDKQHHFAAPPNHPKAHFFVRNVSSAHIIVDLYDNYGSHLPIFLVGISLFQVFSFLHFCFVVDTDSNLTSTSPIAGHEWTWMRIVSDFPACSDLRPEWWRLFTYQFVHAGYEHIAFNMFMQIVFGMPINLVHGNFRFGLIYELGVVGGAVAYATIGGGSGALVGCSGGVYCIIGMMVAEIVINWDVASKGLMNHWTRLFIIAIVLIVDFYLYYFERSESTSYSAHLGGFVVGLLVGIVFLDNIEVSDFEKYFLMPGTHLAVFLCSIGGIYAYLYIFPPIDAILGSKFPPCCWQLLSCSTIEPDEYAFFDCYEPYDLKGGVQFRDTCNELTDWVEQCRDYMAALAQGGDHDDRYEKCLREVRE